MTIGGAWVQPTAEIDDAAWTSGFFTYYLPPTAFSSIPALSRSFYVNVYGVTPGDYDHPFGAAAGGSRFLGTSYNNVGWYPGAAHPEDASWNGGTLQPYHVMLEDENVQIQPYIGWQMYDADANTIGGRTTWERDPQSLGLPYAIEYEGVQGSTAYNSNYDKVHVLRWQFRVTGAYTDRYRWGSGESMLYVETNSYGKSDTMVGYPIVDPNDSQYDSIRFQVFRLPLDSVSVLNETYDSTWPNGPGQPYDQTGTYVTDYEDDSLAASFDEVQQWAWDSSRIQISFHLTNPHPGWALAWTIDWGNGTPDGGDNNGEDLDLTRIGGYYPPREGRPVTYDISIRVHSYFGSGEDYGPFALASVTFYDGAPPQITSGSGDVLPLYTGYTGPLGFVSRSEWFQVYLDAVQTVGDLVADIAFRGNDGAGWEWDHPAADDNGKHVVRFAVLQDTVLEPIGWHPIMPDWTLSAACNDAPDTVWTTGPQDSSPRIIARPIYIPARWRRVYDSVTGEVTPAARYVNTDLTLQLTPQWLGIETIEGVTWTVQWGDGTTSTGLDTLTFHHTYQRANYYNILFQGSKDGASISNTVFIHVIDVPDLSGFGADKRPGFYGKHR